MITFASPVPIARFEGELYVNSLDARVWPLQYEIHSELGIGETIQVSPVVELITRPGEGWVSESRLPGLTLVPSFLAISSLGKSWPGAMNRWRYDIRDAIRGSDLLVASAVGSLKIPLAHLALAVARHAGLKTAVLYDVDKTVAFQHSAPGSWRPYASRNSPTVLLQRYLDGIALRRSDLSVLKVGDPYERMSGIARNAIPELHSMFSANEIVSPIVPIPSISPGPRRIRLVYAGRLLAMKQIELAIDFTVKLGDHASLTVIGDGPAKAKLEMIASRANRQIDFVPALKFGKEYLELLATHDYQVFLSNYPETPRSIVDGFAAGLPAIVASTAYTRYLDRAGAPVLFVDNDNVTLSALEERLASLSLKAVDFAHGVSMEGWLRKRALAFLEVINYRDSLNKYR